MASRYPYSMIKKCENCGRLHSLWILDKRYTKVEYCSVKCRKEARQAACKMYRRNMKKPCSKHLLSDLASRRSLDSIPSSSCLENFYFRR